MLGRIILWISAIMFIGYGLACLVSPQLPAQYAGLALTNGDAHAEMGAMYGGLQTGFGLFCLVAALNRAYLRAGLLLLVCTIGPLGLSRLYFALSTDPAVGSYTWGALAYELTTAILALLALGRSR